MKRKNVTALLFGWLALIMPAIHGAQPADGDPAGATITGRVQNAATGQYLNNARVSVRGTTLVAFTDQSGAYRLNSVPVGKVILDVFYTGLDSQEIAIDAASGQAITQDVDLTSVARYGPGGNVVKLDAFTVSSSRETDAEAIAINEQRHAPNIKNVVAADSFGDVMDGNIGEFLKYMPGVTAVYEYGEDSTVSFISIRGFAPNMVGVSMDGAQLANTSGGLGNTRNFGFNQVSINNVSRIEVAKVPTPSSPADSLSGSVNMVSKSAFERKTAQLRYSLNLTANSENFTLKKTPHTTEENVFKMLPGASFDYTLPINAKFGIVLTGAANDRYGKLHHSYTAYTSGGTNTGASASKPYLQSYRLLDSPRMFKRQSMGIKADWRITPNSVLSFGGSLSHYESKRIATEFAMNVGTNGTPLPASGVPFSYGDDFTIGATGRGSVTMGGAASIHMVIDTKAGNIRYRFDNGDWRVLMGIDASRAQGGYRDTAEGHFRQMAIGLTNPARVVLSDFQTTRPGVLQAFDNNNNLIDIHDVRNYQLTTTNSTPRNAIDEVESGFADIRRDLGFLSIPAAVQIGAAKRIQTRDIRLRNMNWTYNGVNGDRSPAPFLSTLYVDEYHGYGFRGFPHVSPKLAWEAFERNPDLFTKTDAQVRAEEIFRINNSQYFEESVSSLYAQTELSLFNYRLKVLTGVRYEKTVTQGKGALIDSAAVWARDPDGTFARNAAGQRIRRLEAGAVNSMEELGLVYRERQYEASRSYDGFYPSLHFTYNISENLIARAAYARTYGRPDLREVIPTATVDEADLDGESVGDPSVVQGNISVRNTGLLPWTANNYDLSIEYYTKTGGLYSAGVFLKEITEFFGNAVKVATPADIAELGLDPRYVGWRVTTRFNTGDARVSGAEFNVRHSLRELGGWGRPFSVFINGTKLKLEGDRDSDFAAFIPETLNWGFSYSRRPINFMAKWNYRGKQKNNSFPTIAPDGYTYDDRRVILDLNVEYQLRSSLFLFVNAQNVFNSASVQLRYGSETPDYAKHWFTNKNGVGLTLGVKGTF